MKRYSRCAALVAIAASLLAPSARAMINPRFTPIQLVKQSALVVSVDVKRGESKDQYLLTVRETLKDKAKTGTKSFRLDLTKARDEQNADAFRELAAAGKPALFFVGEYAEQEGQGGASGQSRGLLHISGKWASCEGGKDGLWLFDCVDKQSQAVWAGGTDMLRRAVDYILADDDPDVPVTDGAAWSSDPAPIAKLGGAIRAIRPMDLDGDGKVVLFVARDQGDHLLACDPTTRKFTDITVTRGLQSKSLTFAWGDFDGQGRLDLIAFDGKTLSLHAQQADGKFKAQPFDSAAALESGCVGLVALDGGVKGRSSLLVSPTNSWPMLVSLDAGGKPSVVALAANGVDRKALGKAGPCLVADFDGDAVADILAPGETGSALFRGLAAGRFATGVACAVKLGKSPSGACLGDFDGDGRFDVLCVNAEGVYLWQNEGAGGFADMLDLCGELADIGKPGGSDCMAGDVNNDGRQDVLIAYRAGGPHIFFNRGYRSFGHAHTLDLTEQRLLPAAEQGQQSACLGDFDGDGAQDMALALAGGEIWIFYRENDHREARLAVAAMPPGGVCKGPVAVTGWIGKRCLGAWNVLPGAGQACFGRRDAGPVTLKWRLPGGKEQQKEVVMEKGGTVNVEIK